MLSACCDQRRCGIAEVEHTSRENNGLHRCEMNHDMDRSMPFDMYLNPEVCNLHQDLRAAREDTVIMRICGARRHGDNANLAFGVLGTV